MISKLFARIANWYHRGPVDLDAWDGISKDHR